MCNTVLVKIDRWGMVSLPIIYNETHADCVFDGDALAGRSRKHLFDEVLRLNEKNKRALCSPVYRVRVHPKDK